MREPLVSLASAGVLSTIGFYLHDPHGVCGGQALFDPYSVEDYEEADLSGLRLLANPEACGTIEIAYVDRELALSIVEEDWLPLASPSLECTQGIANVSDNEDEQDEEERDEYNDDQT
jgi:hypothetical protein